MQIPDISLSRAVNSFDKRMLGKPVRKEHPVNMEAPGQQFGYILYEYEASYNIDGTLQASDRPRDRIIVYVNEVRTAIIDAVYTNPPMPDLTIRKGDTIQLLVENLGRVDYGPQMLLDQQKGIVGNATLDKTVLKGWNIYPLSFEDISRVNQPQPYTLHSVSKTSIGPPIFSKGHSAQPAQDQFRVVTPSLRCPTGSKDKVWVNGYNFGIYWVVGLQQSLYLPVPILKSERKK